MDVKHFIERKRNGGEHSDGEIQQFVTVLTRGEVPDYQISAWLMAVFIRGLSKRELDELTLAMVHSGETFSRAPGDGYWVDKHSTGGVGDKTSIILVPLVSETAERVLGLGRLKIPMVSGRGLGHTGGTLDKLESVPGFRSALEGAESRALLERQGFFMMGQTELFVPADRKLYSLRDVTATVESLPLIVSSIMSKKLAEGLNGVVFDLKYGGGAFMKSPSDARSLGSALIDAAHSGGVGAQAWITSMEEPLGRFVGNALEIRECDEFLANPAGADAGLAEVTLKLGASMLELASNGELTHEDAHVELSKTWQAGKATKRFQLMLRSQGGDLQSFRMELSKPWSTTHHLSPQTGFLASVDCRAIGELLIRLGGGRTRADDRIRPHVGFEFHKKVGDKVTKGERIATAFLASELQETSTCKTMEAAIKVSAESVPRTRWIYECMN